MFFFAQLMAEAEVFFAVLPAKHDFCVKLLHGAGRGRSTGFGRHILARNVHRKRIRAEHGQTKAFQLMLAVTKSLVVLPDARVQFRQLAAEAFRRNCLLKLDSLAGEGATLGSPLKHLVGDDAYQLQELVRFRQVVSDVHRGFPFGRQSSN